MATKKKKTSKKAKAKSNSVQKLVAVIGLMTLVVSAAIWVVIFKPNIDAKSEVKYLYVGSKDSYQDVAEKIAKHPAIKNPSNLLFILEQKNYPKLLKPGRYYLAPGMNNNEIANMLRSGDQDEVRLLIKSVRDIESLASLLSSELEPDYESWYSLLTDTNTAKKYGFTLERFRTLFIPNTYYVYWSISPERFLERMAYEYKQFWTSEKINKAKALGLSQSDVQILASIVQKESVKKDEYTTIAGVYYNRLKKKMRLQADPTLIYAAKDQNIRRVLNKHKKIDSPYNTYKYRGLPPGPICLPETTVIDSVLNLKEHNFLYFCAREDFSGYHNFASNYNTHLQNARKYQKALNQRGIFK